MSFITNTRASQTWTSPRDLDTLSSAFLTTLTIALYAGVFAFAIYGALNGLGADGAAFLGR